MFNAPVFAHVRTRKVIDTDRRHKGKVHRKEKRAANSQFQAFPQAVSFRPLRNIYLSAVGVEGKKVKSKDTHVPLHHDQSLVKGCRYRPSTSALISRY